MNLPNKLTIGRIFLTPIYLLLLLMHFDHHFLYAALVFFVAAVTDFFDGQIARRQNLVTNLGKFLDPLADKTLTTAALLGFLALKELNPWVVSLTWAITLILTREFMVTSIRLLAAKNGVVVAADIFGKAKTVAQFVALLYMMVALELTTWGLSAQRCETLLLIGCILIWVSVALAILSGIRYVWQNRHHLKDQD